MGFIIINQLITRGPHIVTMLVGFERNLARDKADVRSGRQRLCRNFSTSFIWAVWNKSLYRSILLVALWEFPHWITILPPFFFQTLNMSRWILHKLPNILMGIDGYSIIPYNQPTGILNTAHLIGFPQGMCNLQIAASACCTAFLQWLVSCSCSGG